MDALVAYAWPGNVRELENLIERAAILSPGETLQIDTEVLRTTHGLPVADSSHGTQTGIAPAARTERLPSTSLQDIEHDHILAMLESCDWKVKGRG